ncbi:GntR family transcriptional regulator [Streptomyces griseoluteus]|uniref:GntR family transcriptional regulator n=1 Tax=Streptomyces griseoluteus TaxID=29306 RepID=UPI0037FA14ED
MGSWNAKVPEGGTRAEPQSTRDVPGDLPGVARADCRWGLRDGLPSEAEIGREFGVARTTVRRALRALEESGDIKTVAGVGRSVKERRLQCVGGVSRTLRDNERGRESVRLTPALFCRHPPWSALDFC